MWLVAGLAGESAGVLFSIDLGEALGLRSAGGVTADTEIRRVQFGGHDGWIVRMLRQGTVTGFTIHVGVLAYFFHFQNVCVTGLAGFMAGKVDGTGGDLADRVSAVMAILSKALGNDKVSNYKEDKEGDYEQKREPKKMSCIFEKTHRMNFPSR